MKNGKNIRGALSYNEAKVRAGKAELILAARFGCDVDDLSFSQKLRRFEILNEKCIRSGFTCVHLSLNFHKDDILESAKLQEIAQGYMRQLGFEKQPYLVYRHDDAGHPHLHIVTTPVRQTGTVINLHNLVQRKSEPARKNLEAEFGLILAQGRGQVQGILPIDVQKVLYGKVETKQAIAQIVRHVSEEYRFTNWNEYALILRQYNIYVHKGTKGSRMYNRQGLQYFICDVRGEKIGVPVKASAIYTSPTVKSIESKFERNNKRKEATLPFTASSIRYATAHARNRNEWVSMLESKKIQLIYDNNANPFFIDQRNKTVLEANEIELNNILFLQPEQFQKMTDSLIEQLFETEFSGPELDPAFKRKRKNKNR